MIYKIQYFRKTRDSLNTLRYPFLKECRQFFLKSQQVARLLSSPAVLVEHFSYTVLLMWLEVYFLFLSLSLSISFFLVRHMYREYMAVCAAYVRVCVCVCLRIIYEYIYVWRAANKKAGGRLCNLLLRCWDESEQ